MTCIKEYSELTENIQKVCRNCNLFKDLEFFNKTKVNTDGYSNQCKKCQSDYKKEYFIKNKEKIKNKFKTLSEEDKEKIREQKRQSYELNKHKYENKSKYKCLTDEQRDIIRLRRREYHRNKMENDILYKLKHGFQRRLNKSLKRNKFVYSSTFDLIEIVGCNFEDFKMYLEENFEHWMTWENYGKYNGEFDYGWDIDHVIPVSTACTENEIVVLNHYSNLRPLCSKVNRDIKRNKLLK